MNDEEEYKVASEINHFFEKDNESKPSVNESYTVSKFTITLPELKNPPGEFQPEKDEDGDYLVLRKENVKYSEKVLRIEHRHATELSLVAQQIWRAALLLSDYIIHFQKLFLDKTVLELGTGVGLTSIVAGMFAKQVICTDIDAKDVLKLIEANLNRNKSFIKAETFVYDLNFFNTEWSPSLKEKLKEVNIVIAADVIYDNDVTGAFVKTITKILSIPPKKSLYLAMEKRYVFTISDLDSVAPCYEHLLSCLRSAQTKPPFSEWTMTQITLDFPQYLNYERTKELIMYKITT